MYVFIHSSIPILTAGCGIRMFKLIRRVRDNTVSGCLYIGMQLGRLRDCARAACQKRGNMIEYRCGVCKIKRCQSQHLRLIHRHQGFNIYVLANLLQQPGDTFSI